MKNTTKKDKFEKELKERAKKEIEQKQANIIKKAIFKRKLDSVFAI